MFYLSFPFIAKYVRDFKSASVFLIFTLIPLPIIAYLFKHFTADFMLSSDPQLARLFWARNPLNQFACFAFGFIFYFSVKENKFSFLSNKALNIFFVGLSLAIVILTIQHYVPYIQHAHAYSLAFCILAISLAHWPWTIFSNQIFSFFGRISYSSYLLHFLFLKQLALVIRPSNGLLDFVELFILSVIVTSIFAYISYRLIEQPAMQLGKYLVGQIERSRSHVSYANNVQAD